MYLPYLGIFNKIKNSDVFVILDDALYSKGYYYNRNRIKTPNGEYMITIPLLKQSNCKLNNVKIANESSWGQKHFKTLEANYNKSDFFAEHIEFFEELYTRDWKYLHDINIEIFTYLLEQLDINVPYYYSSQIKIETSGSQRLIDICSYFDADTYLSGIGGKNYIDEELFECNNIQLEYQNYTPVKYKQLWGSFIPNLSAIDALFNLGKNINDVI